MRDKINDANIVLISLCENILNSKSTSNKRTNKSIPSEIKLDDCQSLLNGLKQLFFLSKKQQKLQLLTIAPSDWGRKKIEYYFGCTEHQSKQAILLKKTHGVLARPLGFSGNRSIESDVVEQVVNFYEEDKISRQSTNKKDKIDVSGESKIFRFMEMSVGEAYKVFKEDHATSRIGRSKFYSLRPKWIKIKCPMQNCLCSYHENYCLLLEVRR